MTYQRLPYDDAASPSDMASDCQAVNLALHPPRQVSKAARSAFDVIPDGLVPPAPPQVRRAGVAVSDAAAKLAGRFLD